MLRDLLPFLGYDIKKIPDNAEIYFDFINAPTSWFAFAFIAITSLVLLIIWRITQREHTVCPQPVKKWLGVFRCSALILIFLIFLDPALCIAIKKVSEPHLLFLIDNSGSMKIQDKYLSPESQLSVKPFLKQNEITDRLTLLKRAADLYSVDTEIKNKGELHYFSFDRNLNTELNSKNLQGALQEIKGEQSGTDITQSVKEAINIYNGKKITSVVLISDGATNTGLPLQDLQNYLSAQKIPVYALGLGNYEKSRNIKISDLWVPEKVFKEDPFMVQVKVNGVQVRNENVNLELIEIPLNENSEPINEKAKVIANKKVVFSEDEQNQTIQFEHKPEIEGSFIYKVKVDPFEFETIATDNIKESRVDILAKSAKVLLIGGNSTWDYRMLQTLLVRDKTINVSCWLQSMDIDMMQEGDTQIQKLPETEAELFAYDVVLMIDPNPLEFDEKWILNLQKFIEEKKGGFMYVAGPVYTSKFFNSLSTQKLKDLLPVIYSDLQREHKDFMKVIFESQWPFHLTLEGQNHYLGKLLSDNEKNISLWKNLPGIYWSLPIAESKPGSKVILEHTDPKLLYKEKQRPLLVSGIYGGGRTLFMGFNGVWRWRKSGEIYFDKFWVQCIRYLIEGKLEKDNGKNALYTNKDRYVLSEIVSINAKLFDSLSQPLDKEKVKIKVFKGTNLIKDFELRLETNRKGFYEGEFKAVNQGELQFIIDDTDLPDIRPDKKVFIELPMLEYEYPEMNRDGLTQLCEKTHGKFYTLSKLPELFKDLPNGKETIIVNLPPDSLWDSGRFFILIVLLLSVEWFVRKKYKLL